MKARARLQASTADTATRHAVRRTNMPHQALMISRFGRKAAHVPVFIGPAVAASLRRRQAQGAAVDGVIFLPNERVGTDLVAHELAHAMQQPQAGLGDAAPLALLERLAHAPVLPEHSRAEQAAERAADGAAPFDPAATALPPGVVALRRTVPVAEAEASAPAVATRTEEPTRPAPASPGAGVTTTATEAAPASPTAADSDIAPTFSAPEFVEPTLDPALAAARAAEAQAAEEAMAAAESPAAVMDAYSGMAPSQKALAMGGLHGRLEGSNATAHGKLVEATPAVSVETRGEETPIPLPAPITVPTDAPDITPAAAAAPTVVIPAGPTQPVLAVPPNFNHEMERHFTESATAERVDDQIDAVSTSNPGIQTAVTDRAAVPLDGANNPERLNEAQQQQREAASAKRQEAATAIVTGPGPEVIMPRALAAEVPAPAMAAATASAITPAPEAAQLQELALPETVVADFDQATGAQMAASTATARDQMQTAETTRQTAHDTAVATAETDRVAAEQQADTTQRTAITSQRQVIQDQRQQTVNDQNTAMAQVNGEATQARAAKRTEAETEVRNTQTAISTEYNAAETAARAKVVEGERKAEAEREKKRRESEDQSWWERAAGWIADAFDALVSLVNGIFDLVRSAITGLIELARSAVTALIDLASRALQALVSALGTLLKGLIDGLIGQIFPELAARLNAAIDGAVAFVNERIEAAATALIAGVNAIAGALTSAVNALLDVFQGAFNAAVAILQAAISGDWGALLLQVLDAVLRVLGIDPVAFHAMIAQASDAISIIVNDPGAFVGNMISALVGGIERFSDNFGTHLRRGVIGWLTGALGDIQIPNEWNLWTVLDLVRQIMGLTWDFVRERAARIIGPENVARLEVMASWIGTLITEGWQGLWTRVQDSLASLRDSVLESIRNFLIEKVVMAAIGWLASLFNPVGALVKLVMTIWNIYQFVSAQLQRLMGIAQAVIASISNIAHGVLDPAKQRVEEVLGNLVPVVIDLLMSLLGVTGVAVRVRAIITDLRASIASAVDRMLERVLVTLGLRRGAAGPDTAAAGAGAAGSAGAAGQIGTPLPVQVADGPDHTLSIDRTGTGATVMLRTEPLPLDTWLVRLTERVGRMRDTNTNKALAIGLIADARRELTPLDAAADRVAAIAPSPRPTTPATGAGSGAGAGTSAATLTPMEQRLVPILQRLFDAVGVEDLRELYADNIGSLHSDAQETVRRELYDQATRYIRHANWQAIIDDMRISHALFTNPLRQGNAFSDNQRTALAGPFAAYQTALAADDPKKTVTQEAVKAFMSNEIDHDAGDGAYTELHRQLVLLALKRINSIPTDVYSDAFERCCTQIAARGTSEVDPELQREFTAGTIVEKLIAIAGGGRAGSINEARLEQLWTVQANVDHIKNAFRRAMPGQHEWIPSNYILRVLQRASELRATGQEAAEEAAVWIRVQNAWRTRTQFLIYTPTFSSRVVDGARILQGHSGAVYAALDGTRVTPQTERQPAWHDRLRDIFDNVSTGAESKGSVQAVMQRVDYYIGESVWTGAADSSLNAFNRYFNSTNGPLPLSDLEDRARASSNVIKADFDRAVGVI